MPNDTEPQILNKTLGEVLQNNNHAQGMVMQAMQISPQQLQELLKLTGNNALMNMTIGDLFKNGIVQKAKDQVSSENPIVDSPESAVASIPPVQTNSPQIAQISPQQLQQIMGIFKNGTVIQPQQADVIPNNLPISKPKESILQKLRNFFR